MSLNTTEPTSSSDSETERPESADPTAPHDRPSTEPVAKPDVESATEPVVDVVEEKVRDYRWTRRGLLTLWAVALGIYFWSEGIAADRTRLIFFLAFGMAAATVGRRRVITILIDWLPFVLILMLYDWTRNIAVWLDMPTHWTLAPDVDRLLFGVNPTVWLQSHLKQATPPWWEVVISVVYMSYFIVPYVTAAVLWVRDRAVWRRFAACFIAVSFLGLVGYTLVPAAPPWAASKCTAAEVADHPRDPPCMHDEYGPVDDNLLGQVEPEQPGAEPYTERISSRGWSVLGLDMVLRAIRFGQTKSNLVAAIPSLHAGLTALLALFMWPRSRVLGKTLFTAYAVVMAFALVYTAEHYVFDILLGWGLAALVYAVYRVVDRRYILPRNARREAERRHAEIDATAGRTPAPSRS